MIFSSIDHLRIAKNTNYCFFNGKATRWR